MVLAIYSSLVNIINIGDGGGGGGGNGGGEVSYPMVSDLVMLLMVDDRSRHRENLSTL